jgi:CubicO group peptidase (beta-lactamase class C family)
MSSRILRVGSALLVAVSSAIAAAQCVNTEHSQQQIFVGPQYSSQIQLARQAALEIFDHGFIGNSSSAINNKVGRSPGFSVAVAVNGKLAWAEGFGFADLEQCVPVTPKTKFRIGSTSKPLTAAGAALLYEQGRLDWDAPIQKYVPSFPDKHYVITTRQLLGHLGGIRGYNTTESATLDRDTYHSVIEALKRFKDDPLPAAPGTKWHYTSGRVEDSYLPQKTL